jgi:hypothetical protein
VSADESAVDGLHHSEKIPSSDAFIEMKFNYGNQLSEAQFCSFLTTRILASPAASTTGRE